MSAVICDLPPWLQEVADAPEASAAVERLWESLERTPVLGLTREREGRTEQQVTFLWRQRDDVEVMVHVNGVTDAMREDFGSALLERLPGTDLWHLTWWLPADGTWGYRFVEMRQIPRDAGASHEGWLAIHQAGQLDPHNPAWQPHALGESSSLLVLRDAYQHPGWGPTPSRSQPLAHRDIAGPDGESRAVHLWSPRGAAAGATLVLLDGEQWAELGIADAAAAAALDVEVVLIDTIDFPTRSRDLPDPVRAATLVEAALDTTGGRDPERTIVAGQSYGGLAAASVVLHRPDLARTAIAQSGSYWYSAGEAPMRINREPGDLTRALAAGALGSPPVRLRLHVGTDEGTMTDQATLLQEAARAQGVPAELRVVTGGHDYAWWKHHLLRELEDVLADRD